MITGGQIANCDVFHGRTQPQPHTFRYKIAYFVFDTNESDTFLKQIAKIFHGTIRLRPDDYLDGSATDFNVKIRAYLGRECRYEAESIRLMTMPRMFGYGFNPISFWLCYRDSKLDAVLAEVNNTFGERHCYWIPIPFASGQERGPWLTAQKVFHVSPFFPVDGFYEFRFNDAHTGFQFDIRYKGDDGELRLTTFLKGTLEALESTSFTKFFRRYGWISLLVIIRIHYQALHLWRKKASFFKKPAPPAVAMTTTTPTSARKASP